VTIHLNIRKVVAAIIALLGVFGLIWAVDALAAPFPAALGGTGTSTIPGAGQVAAGNGSTFCYVPSSTNGYVLSQSSTAPCGVAWIPVVGNTVSLAGSSTPQDFIFWNGTNGQVSTSSNVVNNFDAVGDINVGTTSFANFYQNTTSIPNSASTTQFMANGTGLFLPTRQPTPSPTLTPIYNFQGVGVSKRTGSCGATPGCGIATDTTEGNFIIGNSALKITSNGAGTGIAASTTVSSTNMSGQQLKLWIMVANAANINNLRVAVSNDNMVDYYYWQVANMFNTTANYFINNQWVPLTLNFGDARTVGSPVRSQINTVQIQLADNGSGATSTAWVNGLSMFPEPGFGVVTLTWDDNFITQWSVAKPLLDQYGYLGTYYILPENVNKDSTFMDMTELQFIAQQGNDMGIHPTLWLDSSTASSAQQIILNAKNWMASNGLYGTAGNEFAFPNGIFGNSTSSALTGPPALQQYCQEYFTSCRTVINYAGTGIGEETLNPGSPYLLRVETIISTTPTSTLHALDQQAAQNHEWLIYELHQVTTSTPVGSTQMSSSTFAYLLNDIASTPGLQVKTVSDVLSGQEWAAAYNTTSTQVNVGNRGILSYSTSTLYGVANPSTTNALVNSDASGNYFPYAGSSCSAGQIVTSVSATGTVTCVSTPANTTDTINGATGPAFTFTIATGTTPTITSSTSGGSSTIAFTVPDGITFTTTTMTYDKTFDSTSAVTSFTQSTADNALYSVTIPSSTLSNSTALQVHVEGTYLNNTLTAGGFTLGLKYGTVQLFKRTLSGALPSSSVPYDWSATFYLQNASGTTNAQLGSMVSSIAGAGTASVLYNGTSSIDSTASQSLVITGTMNQNTSTMIETANYAYTILVGATTTVVTGINYK